MEKYKVNIVDDGIAIGFFNCVEDARVALKFCKKGIIKVNQNEM